MSGNFTNALSYLLHTLVTFYGLLFLLRLLLQMVRADYHNPICQFVIKLTDPLVMPLRRVLPAIGRLDSACALVFILLSAIALNIKAGRVLPADITAIGTLRLVIYSVLSFYTVVLIAQILLSWLGQNLRHPIIPLIFKLTDPVLRPIRQWVKPMSGLDFSPLIALLAIQFLIRLLGL